MNKPNIHMFSLYNEFYFYDVNTNAIVKIPQEIYAYLQEIMDGKENLIKSKTIENGIFFLKQKGLLTEQYTESTIHFETELLNNFYKHNLNTLTLQVTQNCNLRCKYCVYSGSYINRVHTNKRMNWNTAKKAIDFLQSHSECSSQVAFGFYGGEPLLEFELIKKCVAYINQIFFGKRKTFVITTNATLLNEEKLRFFIENNFSIMISLDGPASVQDGNRVFADNESGTFETIIEKLEMVERIAPDYLEKISFNAVIDLQHNFNEANDFYLTYDLVKDSMVRGTFVNDINRKEAVKINKQYLIDSKYEEFRTMLYYCSNVFNKYSPRILRSYMEGLKQNFADRDIVKADIIQKSTTGGQCVPGIQRLFVTVDGKLFPCERVNEQSEDFCIGNLETGFDIKQAKKLLNVGQLTKDECQKCWCQKICSQCIARADDNGKLSRNRRLENCSNAKASAEKMIKDYIVLKKNKCRFDNLEVEV